MKFEIGNLVKVKNSGFYLYESFVADYAIGPINPKEILLMLNNNFIFNKIHKSFDLKVFSFKHFSVGFISFYEQKPFFDKLLTKLETK